MSRIAPVPPQLAPPEVRAVYESATRTFGRLPLPVAVTAHHPEVFAAYTGFERAFRRASKVDARLTTLVVVQVAALVGCPFGTDIGSALGRAAGVTDAQLRALPDYRKSSRFSEVERLVLDYAVGMTATPVDVPDGLFAELRRHFSDEQVIELTATIAWENYRARFDHALAIEAQGFSNGAFSATPRKPAPDKPASEKPAR
jgi:alkylhydroperoxidase family enzyme